MSETATQYYCPSPFEVAASWIHGSVAPPELTSPPAPSARLALESVLLPAVAKTPCFVAFSGGRDSSAVLAVATAVARHHGLEDPIPVTEFYPGVPESDESEWQELVLAHLKIRDWLRLNLMGQNDLLGDGACASLTQRGLLWPAALHTKHSLLRALRPGSLLTGEGGDEVLGRRRGAQLSRLWRRGYRLPNWSDLQAAGSALAPAPLRRWRQHVRYERSEMQPWLRAHARERHYHLLAADLASEPLSTARSLEWLLTRRSAAIASHNYRRLAAEYDVTLYEPLLSAEFIRALAHRSGMWGFASRTDVMRLLFADLLPDAILARRSKAYFNRAYIGAETHRFAETWDGSGVDSDLVDCEALRSEWLSDFPSAISTPLLHAAWLHGRAREEAPQ